MPPRTLRAERGGGRLPLCGVTEKFSGPALARPHPVLRVLPRDNGADLGASHQAGWTGTIALLVDITGCRRGWAIYGVEGRRFDPGSPPSLEIVTAAEELAHRLGRG